MNLGNKEIMAENIKKFMSSKGVDRNKMSDDLGISYTTISDWVNAKTYPRIDKIEMMANYFNVEKSELVEQKIPNLIKLDSRVVKIPILGTITCGEPILAEQNIEDYREEVEEMLPSGELFYLKTKGDSMVPTIPESSFVLIRRQEQVEDGEIAAVIVNGDDEATLKRVKHQSDVVMLFADNSKYAPIIITPDTPARIIGKAVKVSVDL